MTVKLTSPLAAGQEVMILVDELAMKEPNNQTPIFAAWVSTDRGQATSIGTAFRVRLDMTLKELTDGMGDEIH